MSKTTAPRPHSPKSAANRDSNNAGNADANCANSPPRWTYPNPNFEPERYAPELKLVPFDEVEPTQLFWEGRGGYAPRGCVTVIAGEHGSGKSLLAIDWAASISAGYPAFQRSAGARAAANAQDAARAQDLSKAEGDAKAQDTINGDSPDKSLYGPFPGLDGQPLSLTSSEAVIAHAGDLTLGIVRRRIDAAGGLPERIAALALDWPDREEKFTFLTLRKRICALTCAVRGSADVRLLVIDNLEALAGNLHEPPSAALLGFLLANLTELAARANLAIVALAHLPHGGGQAAARKLEALSAAAPVVYMAADDPEQPGRKLLLTVKNTLAPPAPARSFEIVDGRAVMREENRGVSVADFIAPASRRLEVRHDREQAARWLLGALADGPVASRELFRQARDCGISTRTLRRAADSLGLAPRKSSFDGPWQWQLAAPATKKGTQLESPKRAASPFSSQNELRPLRPLFPEPAPSASVSSGGPAASSETEVDASGLPEIYHSPSESDEDGQPRDAELAAPLSSGSRNGRLAACGA